MSGTDGEGSGHQPSHLSVVIDVFQPLKRHEHVGFLPLSPSRACIDVSLLLSYLLYLCTVQIHCGKVVFPSRHSKSGLGGGIRKEKIAQSKSKMVLATY